MFRKAAYFITLLTVLASCNEKPAGVALQYYDLRSLLDQQVQTIIERNPTLVKQAQIDKVSEDQTLRKDSAAWAAELSILYEADINKADLADSYIKEEKENQVVYKSRYPQETEIVSLIIRFDEQGNVNRVESHFREHNSLYSTQRFLEMHFEEQKEGEPLLSNYIIEGKQKMILNDTIRYKIDSRLIYN